MARLEVARPLRLVGPNPPFLGWFARAARRLSTGLGEYSLIVSVPRTAVPSSRSKGDSNMARRLETPACDGVWSRLPAGASNHAARSMADIIIAKRPRTRCSSSDLEGKILAGQRCGCPSSSGSARTRCSSSRSSRFISPEETREFTAALPRSGRAGWSRGTWSLNPRSARGEVIPTSLKRLRPCAISAGRAIRRDRHPARTCVSLDKGRAPTPRA